MDVTVNMILSKSVLKSPALNILKILPSLKALSALKAPPPPPFYVAPVCSITISIILITTIVASNKFILSDANPDVPKPINLMITSSVKMIENTKFKVPNTSSTSCSQFGYLFMAKTMVLIEMTNMIKPLNIGELEM